jgi:hypothetical protein
MESHDSRSRVLKLLALVAALVVAFLSGVLVERLRFDTKRTDMLRRYDQALRQHREQLMQSEKHSGAQKAPAPSVN